MARWTRAGFGSSRCVLEKAASSLAWTFLCRVRDAVCGYAELHVPLRLGQGLFQRSFERLLRHREVRCTQQNWSTEFHFGIDLNSRIPVLSSKFCREREFISWFFVEFQSNVSLVGLGGSAVVAPPLCSNTSSFRSAPSTAGTAWGRQLGWTLRVVADLFG